jgi:hypothetical protein
MCLQMPAFALARVSRQRLSSLQNDQQVTSCSAAVKLDQHQPAPSGCQLRQARAVSGQPRMLTRTLSRRAEVPTSTSMPGAPRDSTGVIAGVLLTVRIAWRTGSRHRSAAALAWVGILSLFPEAVRTGGRVACGYLATGCRWRSARVEDCLVADSAAAWSEGATSERCLIRRRSPLTGSH